jgi:hypothetical protein
LVLRLMVALRMKIAFRSPSLSPKSEHDPFGKPVPTHRGKPEGMLFRIML